jgi:hypothetical protein
MAHIFRKMSFILLLPVVLMLLSSFGVYLQSSVSAKEQYLIFMKVLSYNRNLSQQVGDTLKLGIVFQEKYRASTISHREFLLAAKQSSFNKINGIPISCISMPFGDYDQLVKDTEANGIDVLYISPLRVVNVKDILKLSRENDLITITAETEYCDAGVSTGLELIDERVRIVINLEGAKEEGTDYSSQLLKLALIKR